MQTVGANTKATKAYNDLDTRQQNAIKEQAAAMTILFKKARIVGGAVIRWKRSLQDDPAEDVGNHPNGDEEEQPEQGEEGGRPYTSRMLACTRCEADQETEWMQLRNKEGFRAVHCKTCRLQERCINNKCQCGVIWHHCLIHRIDPRLHRSRKAPNKSKEERWKEKEALRQKTEERRKRKRST